MKIVTNRIIWDYLKKGMPLILLTEGESDELIEWVKFYEASLLEMFGMVKSVCNLTYLTYITDDMTFDEVTNVILSLDKNFHPILFGMYEGKNVNDLMWDRIYPQNERIFVSKNL